MTTEEEAKGLIDTIVDDFYGKNGSLRQILTEHLTPYVERLRWVEAEDEEIREDFRTEAYADHSRLARMVVDYFDAKKSSALAPNADEMSRYLFRAIELEKKLKESISYDFNSNVTPRITEGPIGDDPTWP